MAWVELPDHKVRIVIEIGETSCRWDCEDECIPMQEQLFAMTMGWA